MADHIGPHQIGNRLVNLENQAARYALGVKPGTGRSHRQCSEKSEAMHCAGKRCFNIGRRQPQTPKVGPVRPDSHGNRLVKGVSRRRTAVQIQKNITSARVWKVRRSSESRGQTDRRGAQLGNETGSTVSAVHDAMGRDAGREGVNLGRRWCTGRGRLAPKRLKTLELLDGDSDREATQVVTRWARAAEPLAFGMFFCFAACAVRGSDKLNCGPGHFAVIELPRLLPPTSD